ncbi:hypothetical protein RJ639_003496 [Escallonia herrerae]|uniref:Uncharacterized protein n=1 Tax=Escallonia herrerae TaxID=1293975 RepID=A0AA88W0Z0_9ASTE|nr:hypothetical protein RJ639_003496 [Escallonia herrerae]
MNDQECVAAKGRKLQGVHHIDHDCAAWPADDSTVPPDVQATLREQFYIKVDAEFMQVPDYIDQIEEERRFLQEDAPGLGDNPDRQTVAAVDAWKHSDFLCKNYILNGLDNSLYNVYSPMLNAKVLWESLEKKYKTEDAGSKKFVVGKFLDFKMVDSMTVVNQVQEFQLTLHDIHAEGMVLGESFQVVTLIEKLPPTWKDFKNYLKYKHKEMKLEDLILRLRIKEDNRQSEKKAGNYHQEAKANVVEQVYDIHFNTIIEIRNVHFFEDVFPHKAAQERSSLERTNMDQEASQEEDKPRRSKRARINLGRLFKLDLGK